MLCDAVGTRASEGHFPTSDNPTDRRHEELATRTLQEGNLGHSRLVVVGLFIRQTLVSIERESVPGRRLRRAPVLVEVRRVHRPCLQLLSGQGQEIYSTRGHWQSSVDDVPLNGI